MRLSRRAGASAVDYPSFRHIPILQTHAAIRLDKLREQNDGKQKAEHRHACKLILPRDDSVAHVVKQPYG